MFDPKPHLIQLPRKVKDNATGHWTTVYEDYLEVKWRLCWFRDRYPHGVITTEEICVDLDRGYAHYKATVADGQGGTATGYGTETAGDFADYCERAETRALGRALAALGIGTPFVGQDLTEGEHVADAPVRQLVAQPVNGDAPPPRDPSAVVNELNSMVNGDTLPLTVVPTDGGLPCGGQAISTLKPAQLAMLISKPARLVSDGADQWVTLLHALQAERATRLDRGRKPRRPDPDPDPVGPVGVPEGDADGA
jgi:hypothetical protein